VALSLRVTQFFYAKPQERILEEAPQIAQILHGFCGVTVANVRVDQYLFF